MSIIKSYSVGNGDMFLVEHGNGTFSIIDCNLIEEREEDILEEVAGKTKGKLTRFISTHPDEDHIGGLEKLDDEIKILNFYCVRNEAKKGDGDCFTRYCELRDSNKAYFLRKGISRKWITAGDDDRRGAGIGVLWPDESNEAYLAALAAAIEGESPNNLSPIIQYHGPSAKFLWLGDLETDFMEKIHAEVDVGKVDIIFAPHHGRDSGKIPNELLERLDPRIIVIGEAPSEHLHYYPGYNTITQHSAGDIVFDCNDAGVDIFTTREYAVDFLENENRARAGFHYVGTLKRRKKAP